MPSPGSRSSGSGSSSGYYATGETDVSTYNSKRRLLALQREAPELDPTTMWGLASSGMADADMLGAARTSIGQGALKETADLLRSTDRAKQQAVWSGYSSARQKQLMDAGYVPPDAQAKSSEGWWQTALLAAPRAIRWGYDKSSLDRVVDKVGIDDVTNFTMDTLSNAGDDVAGRPYRTLRDQAGQEQTARMELTLGRARRDLEDQGIRLTDEQWNGINGRYLTQNPLHVNYVGDENADPGTGTVARQAIAGTGFMGAIINLGTDLPGVQNLPGIKQLADRTGHHVDTWNPYSSQTGATVPDDLYVRFEQAVHTLQDRPDYSMSGWASWNRVDNGRTYITPRTEKSAMDKLGGVDSEALDLATFLAGGRTMEEYVEESAGLNPASDKAAFDAEYSRLQQSYMDPTVNPVFSEVVEDMSRDQSKVSIGRDYARAIGMPDDSPLFTLTSGLVDATNVSVMDPTMILGKATKTARAARLMVRAEEMPRVFRAMESIAAHEGVWKMADDAAQVKALGEVTSHLNLRLAGQTDSALSHIDDLVDADGIASPFLIEHHADVTDQVKRATDELTAKPFKTSEDLAQLDNLEAARQLLDTAHPVIDNPDLGGAMGRVRYATGKRQLDWATRISEAFPKTVDVDQLKLVELSRDVPRSIDALPGMQQWHLANIAAGGDGLSTVRGVMDFMQDTAGLTALADGSLSSRAIRGVGSGNTPDAWRLWGTADKDLGFVRPLDQNLDELAEAGTRSNQSMVQLPELGRTTRWNRKVINAADDVIQRAMEVEGRSTLGRAVRKPINGPAKLAYALTHQIPTSAALSVADVGSGAELRKLIDAGAMYGIKRSERDVLLEKLLGGVEYDQTVRYMGGLDEAQAAAGKIGEFSDDVALWQATGYGGHSEAARSFAIEFGDQRLLGPNGRATDWYVDNWDQVNAWRDRFLKESPELVDDPYLKTLGEFVPDAQRVSTVATRMGLVKGYLDALFSHNGVTSTEAGREWADNFLGKIESAAYTPNNEDLMKVGSQQMRVGMLPMGHYSEYLMIPEYAELERQAKKLGVTRRSLGALNRPFVDAAMGKAWKPITLMRLGFISRAVGEEALALFGRRGLEAATGYAASAAIADRRGPVSGLVAKILRTPAKHWGELYGLEDAADVWKLSEVAKYHDMRSYMEEMSTRFLQRPAAELRRLDQAALVGDYMSAKVMKRLRRAEFSVLPDQMKRAALTMAGATGKEELVHAVGLDALYDHFGRKLGDDAANLLRHGELVKRGMATELAAVGNSTIAGEGLENLGPHETLAVRHSAYDTDAMYNLEVRVGRNWQKIEIPDVMNDATGAQLAYSLQKLTAEPAVREAIEAGLAGRITPAALLEFWAPRVGVPVFLPEVDDVARNVAETGRQKLVSQTAERLAGRPYEAYETADLARLWHESPVDPDLLDEIDARRADGTLTEADADHFVSVQTAEPDSFDPTLPAPPAEMPGAVKLAQWDEEMAQARQYIAENPIPDGTLYDPTKPRVRFAGRDVDVVDRQLRHIQASGVEAEGAAQIDQLPPDARGSIDQMYRDAEASTSGVTAEGDRIDQDHFYRGVSNDDQWYVDDEGALHIRANEGANSTNVGESASATVSPEFAHDWTQAFWSEVGDDPGNPVVLRISADTARREGLVRGVGTEAGEYELLAQSGETVIPAGQWKAFGHDTATDMGDLTMPVNQGAQHTRNALLDELEQIGLGELDPASSKYFAEPADDGVAQMLRDVQQRGTVALEPETVFGWKGTATRADEERVLAEVESRRQRIQQWDQRDLDDIRAFNQSNHKLGVGRPRKGATLAGLEAEVDQLPPHLKRMLDHVPEDSALERVTGSAIRKAIGGDDQMLKDLISLTSIADDSRRWATVLTGSTPLKIADEAADREAMTRAIFAKLQASDQTKYVQGSMRAMWKDGAPVQAPLAPGTRRAYTVMADQGTIDGITGMLRRPGGVDELLSGLRAAGMNASQEANVRAILAEWDTDLADLLAGNRARVFNGSMAPLTGAQFANYQDADDLARLLKEWTPAAGDVHGSVPRSVSAGYIDAPDAKAYAQFGGDPVWRSQRGDHLLQIPDHKLAESVPFTDLPQVRYDERGIPTRGGVNVVEGQPQEEVLRDWAQALSDMAYSQLVAPNGQVLHEIVEPARLDNLTVDAVTSMAPSDLPQNLYAPEMYSTDGNWWSKAVRKGFSGVINPAIFAGVRHPQYMLAFSDQLEAARGIMAHLRDTALDNEVGRIMHGAKGSIEDVRAAWHAIPDEARDAIRNGTDLVDAAQVMVDAGKLDEANAIFGLSSEQLDTVARWAPLDARVEHVAVRNAMRGAMDQVTPYIDDHAVRSFFQVQVRNVMPFEFATEAFLKRWVRGIQYSPEALRRAQLLAHGFTSSGFVHEDQYGDSVFTFPASESLGQLLTKTPLVSSVFGKAGAIPVSVPLTGSVKTMLPGVPGDVENLPSLSPIAMVPARTVVGLFPEARAFVAPFNGGRPVKSLSANPQALAQAVVEQFVPANYQRAMMATFGVGTDAMHQELDAATIGAMQMMEAEALRLRAEANDAESAGDSEAAASKRERANTLSPPDGADATAIEQYQDAVKDWARTNMLTRAVVGWSGPTSARNEFEGMELADDFKQMLPHMEFDEALAVFLAEHPDARPWTVFASEKSTKAPIPPTEAALNWMDENRDYLDAFPLAGPWLMPQSNGEELSQQAYTDQVALGLRGRKTPKEWYESYKFASAANEYFPAKARYDALYAGADTDTRQQLRARWDAWTTQFKAQHPLFTQKLNSGGGTEAADTLAELRIALSDPAGPSIDHKAETITLLDSWDRYTTERELLSDDNSTSGRKRKKELDNAFLDWGWRYVGRTPTLRSMWTGLVIPATDLRSLDTTRELLSTTGGN